MPFSSFIVGEAPGLRSHQVDRAPKILIKAAIERVSLSDDMALVCENFFCVPGLDGKSETEKQN